MKKITEEQVKTITDAFFQCNAPVQMYVGVQKMLSELPDCKEVEEEAEVIEEK